MLEFFDDASLLNIQLLNRAITRQIKVLLAQFLSDELGYEVTIKNQKEFMKLVNLDEKAKAFSLTSSRPQATELLEHLLLLRPDIEHVIVDQCLDVQSIIKFLSKNLQQVKTLTFRRFMWYDERSEIVGKFMQNNTTIQRLSIETVFDCNKGLTELFKQLHSYYLRHLHVACNLLDHYSTPKLVSCIGKLTNLRVLDLSCVKVS